MRRTGRARRPRPDRRRDRLAPARRRSSPTSRRGPGVDLPPHPGDARARRSSSALPTMGYIGNPLDPWGAADPPTAYGACFEAMAASGAYDVLVLVHDFPYRSMPAEVATANDVTSPLLAATRDRPRLLPVYVSLTSGEPPPETKAVLDEHGGGAPLLRGAVEAFTRDRARSPAGRRRRAARGGRRARGGRAGRRSPPTATSLRRRTPPRGRRAAARRATRDALPRAREPGPAARGRAAGHAGHRRARRGRRRRGRPTARRPRRRPQARRRRTSPTRATSGSSRSGSSATSASAPRPTTCWRLGRRHGLDIRGLLVEPMADPGVELIVGLQPRPVVRAGGHGRAGRRPRPRSSTTSSIRLAPVPTRRGAGDARRAARARAILDGVRGRPPVDREARRRAHRRPVARSAIERPDIVEVDLNPVIASPDGAVAVDALVVLAAMADAASTTRVVLVDADAMGRPPDARTGRPSSTRSIGALVARAGRRPRRRRGRPRRPGHRARGRRPGLLLRATT